MSSPMMTGRAAAFSILLAVGLVLAGAASATPITMTPSLATVDAVIGNDFTLRLDAGDSVTRTLDFTVLGSGGCGPLCPSTAVAMIVFDGATVLSAQDTNSGLLSPGNVVRGFMTSRGAVAALLIDLGAPSAESFRLTLSAVPTTATLYALNLSAVTSFEATRALRSGVVSSTRLTFTTVPGGGSYAVPEPSAALVFGSGLLVAACAVRRSAA
ncbi:MAG: hypothetical protein U0900_23730 [Myxococcota bacterium]